MAQSTEMTQAELARLGVGGTQDRLTFRLVLRVLWRTVPLLKEVKWHLLWLVLLCLGLALVAVYPALQFFDLFFTRVLRGETPTSQQCGLFSLFGTVCEPWTVEARRSGLRAMIGMASVLVLVGGSWFAGIYYYRLFILQRINHVLRLKLHDRLHALSLRFHSDTSIGDGIYRMYQDSSMVTQLIDTLILLPLMHIGLLLFAAGVVSLYRPGLALALLAGWAVSLVIGYRYSRPMRVGYRSAREHNAALTSMIQASAQGMRVIKAYGAEKPQQQRFEALSQAAFREGYDARRRYAVFTMLVYFVFGAVAIMAVAYGALLASRGESLWAKTVLALFGFTVWNVGLWSSFRGRFGGGTFASFRLFELWGRMQDTAIGLDRVYERLDLEPEVKDAPDAIAMPSFREKIEFDDVSFAYDPQHPTLRNVTFTATAGAITAVVGPTGSGKSTTMSLLLRLYDADAGAIRIDGTDIRRIKLDSLRANVAIALQENLLFGTTIRENIRYAVPDASDEAVREAARVAAADEFIDKLPEGYDTLLGERGAKLSTGQRQRLSIARAILKNAPILILDEPTAALDAETELRVLDNLTRWGQGRAVFLITHRLSTIRRAQQVIFVQDGRVLERGTHEALMATHGGAYRRLVEGEQAAARALPLVAAS